MIDFTARLDMPVPWQNAVICTPGFEKVYFTTYLTVFSTFWQAQSLLLNLTRLPLSFHFLHPLLHFILIVFPVS